MPRKVVGPFQIRYLYDAAGNKLQKQVETFGCPPQMQCPPPSTETTDYVGNFVYQNGQLEMVYHPEGVIRPTPQSAENTTDYVYDYFIKDYLGNVRVVLTEENATYDTALVATMEEYRAAWEEDNFDGIDEGREPKPFGYPIDASFPFNEFIAKVVAENEMTIGPSKVMEVNRGENVKLATRYFFQEDAPGTTYEGLGFLVEEILTSLAAAGAGVLHYNESRLVKLVEGNTGLNTDLFNFLSTEMDTTDMSKPHAYLVWLAYDRDLKLDPTTSGALRVVDPNELGTLFSGEIPINQTGYLHVYVANGTQGKAINFDNLYITTMQGKTRQINHYYPYGMRMRLGHGKKYNNMYTGKELQTGEYWDASVSTGLEMYDFEARFFDPQLGRWMVPDPAEQFHNPYLGIGNNPVKYTDPDGEFIVATVLIGAAISGTIGYIGGRNAGLKGGELFSYTLGSAVIGGISGGVGASIGAGVSASLSFGGFAGGFVAGAAGGASGGFVGGIYSTALNNSTFGTNNNVFLGGLKGAAIGGIAGGLAGGIARGISDFRNGYSFWDGSTVDEVLIQGGNPEAIAAKYNSSSQADVNDEFLKIRIQDEFKVTEGDFGIDKITTRTSRGYGMDVSGDYVNLKTGRSVGGYVKRFSTGTSNLHVSPNSTFSSDVVFRSVAGHELIHSYHHFTIPNFSRVFSERVAYRYTYNTYMGAGQVTKAFNYYNLAVSHGFWGSYPGQYQIPIPLGW